MLYSSVGVSFGNLEQSNWKLHYDSVPALRVAVKIMYHPLCSPDIAICDFFKEKLRI